MYFKTIKVYDTTEAQKTNELLSLGWHFIATYKNGGLHYVLGLNREMPDTYYRIAEVYDTTDIRRANELLSHDWHIITTYENDGFHYALGRRDYIEKR